MSEKLSADLNIIQSAPIELELLDGDLNIIQKLDDEPNDVGGLTSAELKAKFDESGNIIKKYINWHNTARRQLTLNGMTPEEYRNHAVQESA